MGCSEDGLEQHTLAAMHESFALALSLTLLAFVVMAFVVMAFVPRRSAEEAVETGRVTVPEMVVG